MSLNDIQVLTKLSNFFQLSAIILIFLGGTLQISKYYIDNKIKNINKDNTQEEKLKSEKIIEGLNDTISFQSERIEKQFVQIEAQKDKIKDIELSAKNRSIPKDQVFIIQNELRKNADNKIQIICAMGDKEANDFAFNLMRIFQTSGWKIKEVTRAMQHIQMKGMLLIFKNETDKTKYEYIINRFKSIGFDLMVQFDPTLSSDIQILIGSKK